MALFDSTQSAAQPAKPASSRPEAVAPVQSDKELSDSASSQTDASKAIESLSQLRLALDFATARQALTRKQMVQAQAKRDRWQSQFAQRAESRVLRQRAQRRDQDSNEAIAQLQAQLTAQAQQIDSLAQRILALQDELAHLEGFSAEAPTSPCTAFMPPGLMERFTGQIEL